MRNARALLFLCRTREAGRFGAVHSLFGVEMVLKTRLLTERGSDMDMTGNGCWKILLGTVLLLTALLCAVFGAGLAEEEWSDPAFEARGMTFEEMIPEGATMQGDTLVYEEGLRMFYSVISFDPAYEENPPDPRVVALPASMTAVEAEAWRGWFENVQEYQVSPENPYFKSVDGVIFTKDGKTLVMFPSGRSGSYTMPDGVTAVVKEAFTHNFVLEELTIAEGITSIEFIGELFSGHDYLEAALHTIHLSSTVETVERRWLWGQNLTNVHASANSPYFHSEDGVLFSQSGTLVIYPRGRQADAYDVSYGVQVIGEGAFVGAKTLKSVSLSSTVQKIEENAFVGCVYLEEVALPLGLKAIGENVFANCVHLERLVVPPGTEVSPKAFYNCPLLGFVEEYSWGGTDNAPVDPESYRVSGVMGILNPENAWDKVIIRSEPSKDGEIVARYACGTTVTVYGQKNGFFQIEADELRIETQRTGFVLIEEVQISGPLQRLFEPVAGELGQGISQADVLSGRWALPDREDGQRSLFPGEKAKVYWQGGQWYGIETKNVWGYIPANKLKVYAKEIPPGKTCGVVINSDQRERLNLREKPDRKSAALGKYFSGTQVEILSETGDWYEVRVGWEEGYMMKEFVQLVEVVP